MWVDDRLLDLSLTLQLPIRVSIKVIAPSVFPFSDCRSVITFFFSKRAGHQLLSLQLCYYLRSQREAVLPNTSTKYRHSLDSGDDCDICHISDATVTDPGFIYDRSFRLESIV